MTEPRMKLDGQNTTFVARYASRRLRSKRQSRVKTLQVSKGADLVGDIMNYKREDRQKGERLWKMYESLIK